MNVLMVCFFALLAGWQVCFGLGNLAWVWDRKLRMIPHISHIFLLLLWEKSFLSMALGNRGRTYGGNISSRNEKEKEKRKEGEKYEKSVMECL